MNRLRIKHSTGFKYGGEVTASYNEARMLPVNTGHQLVLYSHLDISPSAAVNSYTDYWRTRVSAFELLTPHDQLTLTAESLIEVQQRQMGLQLLSWDDLPKAYCSQTQLIEQTAQTQKTEPADEVIEIARQVAAGKTPGQAAEAICLAIKNRMDYVPGSTTVNTNAQDAWEHGKGVCQDITHVCLGALRAVGIPARYVSGYLHPENLGAEVGKTVAGESHAWVEWFTGEWNGFDPTNSTEVGGKHVVVGRGRDYNDVPPLKGVYDGPFASELFVTVEVTLES